MCLQWHKPGRMLGREVLPAAPGDIIELSACSSSGQRVGGVGQTLSEIPLDSHPPHVGFSSLQIETIYSRNDLIHTSTFLNQQVGHFSVFASGLFFS